MVSATSSVSGAERWSSTRWASSPWRARRRASFSRLVSYRYHCGSTLITTNKAVKDWQEILAGDEAMAAALLDRLLYRCHFLNLRGRS